MISKACVATVVGIAGGMATVGALLKGIVVVIIVFGNLAAYIVHRTCRGFAEIFGWHRARRAALAATVQSNTNADAAVVVSWPKIGLALGATASTATGLASVR